jgi:tetratricopeptide (TPR) repeat protein
MQTALLTMSQFEELKQLEIDAWKCFKSGKYDDAVKMFTKAIIFLGTDLIEAVPLFAGRRFASSLSTFAAISLIITFNSCSLAYVNKEEPELAIVDANIALSLNPQNSKALLALGRAVFLAGDAIKALSICEEGLAIDSANEVKLLSFVSVAIDV